ncbi:DUF423 domain-containing protein [Aureisphaera galaxeae]|uniref:DUF423 domain-containing protein n=1 Tax=Aureisphaera galaxeae TaxID=1538023 RepID=UPI0023501230|nr:DUF423 domain-containing protein [Aureisphaera galaxeae]MDC8002780.1 DUF423 domain-containing protein [Aureisphaera galaxeae]
MNKFNKKILIISSLLGAITIAIGAFGAHGLKQVADAQSVASFETGVRYQMYHVIVLFIVGFIPYMTEKGKKWVFRLFLLGILLFSGSIYLLALKEVVPISSKILGPITPLGGLAFIAGWLRLAYDFRTLKS